MVEESVSLNEFDRNEWYDVYRLMKPNGTRQEFEIAWKEFQELKAAHLENRNVQ